MTENELPGTEIADTAELGFPKVAATDVYITRMFAAPRDVVFRFWTEPAQLATWFGPKGWHSPVEDIVFEPEVGGRFELRMVADDGSAESGIFGTVDEILPPELITIVMSAPALSDLPAPQMKLRVQFHDHGDRTRMTLHQGPFGSVEQVDQTIQGWGESFDKIDSYV